jgi:hypothetical protein
MTEHSLLGASSAHRWLSCPGSFRLSQTAPHRPSSIYAATGTLAHEMIETGVRDGSFRCDESRREQTLLRDDHLIKIDRDLIDGVNLMLGYLHPLRVRSTWSGVEFRVDLAEYFPMPPSVSVFGTVDAAALVGKTLEVIDYKNGSGITVDAALNPQLLFYAAGVLPYLRQDFGKMPPLRHIKLTIVQPHAQGVAPIRSWEIDVVDLLMWVDEVLIPGVEACAEQDAPLNPGTWCRFCPVAHACPKLTADALEMAKAEFDDVPQEPDALAQALDTAERAELWISRIREFAIDQLQHQVRIPGWGLVPTRPTRKWLAPDADIVRRLVDLGVDIEEVWEERVRSPAQMEKLLHRSRKGRAIWDKAAVMVEARSSGVKLGRDGSTDAHEDFTNVE